MNNRQALESALIRAGKKPIAAVVLCEDGAIAVQNGSEFKIVKGTLAAKVSAKLFETIETAIDELPF